MSILSKFRNGLDLKVSEFLEFFVFRDRIESFDLILLLRRRTHHQHKSPIIAMQATPLTLIPAIAPVLRVGVCPEGTVEEEVEDIADVVGISRDDGASVGMFLMDEIRVLVGVDDVTEVIDGDVAVGDNVVDELRFCLTELAGTEEVTPWDKRARRVPFVGILSAESAQPSAP